MLLGTGPHRKLSDTLMLLGFNEGDHTDVLHTIFFLSSKNLSHASYWEAVSQRGTWNTCSNCLVWLQPQLHPVHQEVCLAFSPRAPRPQNILALLLRVHTCSLEAVCSTKRATAHVGVRLWNTNIMLLELSRGQGILTYFILLASISEYLILKLVTFLLPKLGLGSHSRFLVLAKPLHTHSPNCLSSLKTSYIFLSPTKMSILCPGGYLSWVHSSAMNLSHMVTHGLVLKGCHELMSW